MPAALPGSTLAQNLANPSVGPFINFDPLSGPKGSPLDKDNSGNASTGALATGIGIGDTEVINIAPTDWPQSAAQSIFRAGFNDNEIPGEHVTYSAGGPPPVVAANVVDSTRMYIGGGRSNADGTPNPYTAGIALCGAGNGGSRDGGTGPAFQGFPMKMVTATGPVANGVAIETGWTNRSGVALIANQSCFGSGTVTVGAPS